MSLALKNNIFIVDGVRTAIGSPFRSLKSFTAVQLAAALIKELPVRCKIKKDLIEEIILGNTVSAGLGQNIARQAAVQAELPETVPGFTVNNVCGGGLQSIILACQSILTREFDMIIAGGTESATHAPYLVHKNVDQKYIENNLIDSLVYDGLRCSLTGKRMGELSDDLAARFNISRPEQDIYAFNSHRKAVAAQQQEKFKREIVPLSLSATHVFARDERPKKDLTLDRLKELKPVFNQDGTATAGSSCVPCDGAAAVLVASREMIKDKKLKPMARILGYASVAMHPKMVFAAGILGVDTCLKNSGLTTRDIDLFEISEAFATQSILMQKKLHIPDDKLNIWGGDIALGHPLGAAGARILVTLVHALRDQKKKKGLACACLGGGGAIAMAIEVI